MSGTRLIWEVSIVLAVTVGQSALYSVLSLVRALLRPTPIGDQQTQLNPSRDVAAFWDVLYQLLSVFFGARARRPRVYSCSGSRA